MAAAVIKPAVPAVTEVRVISEARPERIVLELSSDEARALRDVLSFVGGSPTLSRRRHTKAVGEALDKIGICYRSREERPDTEGYGMSFHPLIARHRILAASRLRA
jgi:hypothetical protein